jgi:hypothetical protein
MRKRRQPLFFSFSSSSSCRISFPIEKRRTLARETASDRDRVRLIRYRNARVRVNDDSAYVD